jgi:hypothetical protein
MRWVFFIFDLNRFGKAPLHNTYKDFDFAINFQEISKIDSPLSMTQGVAKMYMGNPLFQTFK